MNKRQIIFKEIQKLENSISKKGVVLQEKYNNDVVARHIQDLVSEGKGLPEDSPFDNLLSWNSAIMKKDNKYKNQLEKIENNTIVMEALNKFITNYSETVE